MNQKISINKLKCRYNIGRMGDGITAFVNSAATHPENLFTHSVQRGKTTMVDEIKTPRSTPRKSSENRKKTLTIQVRVTPEELATIQHHAESFGLTPPTMLRKLGLGIEPKSIYDKRVVKEIFQTRADLNRVGGLIKLWLSERETKLPHSSGVSVSDLQSLVGKVRSVSDEIVNALGGLKP